MFEHFPLYLEARNGRIKEITFFEGEAKYSEQIQIGAINCAPPFTDQREDFNTCRNGITDYRRQCGPVVRALALKSGDPGFKTRSDHSLNLFLVVPGSTSQLHL